MSVGGHDLANSLSHDILLRLARQGAETRLRELKSEIASIQNAFPDLSGTPGRSPRRSRRRVRRTVPRRKRAWSAAARRAVSERMKRYWAARRAGRKK